MYIALFISSDFCFRMEINIWGLVFRQRTWVNYKYILMYQWTSTERILNCIIEQTRCYTLSKLSSTYVYSSSTHWGNIVPNGCGDALGNCTTFGINTSLHVSFSYVSQQWNNNNQFAYTAKSKTRASWFKNIQLSLLHWIKAYKQSHSYSFEIFFLTSDNEHIAKQDVFSE